MLSDFPTVSSSTTAIQFTFSPLQAPSRPTTTLLQHWWVSFHRLQNCQWISLFCSNTCWPQLSRCKTLKNFPFFFCPILSPLSLTSPYSQPLPLHTRSLFSIFPNLISWVPPELLGFYFAIFEAAIYLFWCADQLFLKLIEDILTFPNTMIYPKQSTGIFLIFIRYLLTELYCQVAGWLECMKQSHLVKASSILICLLVWTLNFVLFEDLHFPNHSHHKELFLATHGQKRYLYPLIWFFHFLRQWSILGYIF